MCSSTKARLSLSSKGLPVLTCNACNFQGFARSDTSDLKLRALLLHDEPAAPVPAPLPAPAPAPTPAAAPSWRRAWAST